MKKITSLILLVAMLSLTVLALASCSTYSGIEKNFLKEDYETVDIQNNTIAKAIEEEFEGKDFSCTLHLLRKSAISGYVLILEFSSSKDIDEVFGEKGSETVKGLIKDAQKSDYVNGNCLLIPLDPIYASEALELFKK